MTIMDYYNECISYKTQDFKITKNCGFRLCMTVNKNNTATIEVQVYKIKFDMKILLSKFTFYMTLSAVANEENYIEPLTEKIKATLNAASL